MRFRPTDRDIERITRMHMRDIFGDLLEAHGDERGIHRVFAICRAERIAVLRAAFLSRFRPMN